jgi:hypothetical protein
VAGIGIGSKCLSKWPKPAADESLVQMDNWELCHLLGWSWVFRCQHLRLLVDPAITHISSVVILMT